jgi:uncharacterized cysteine cluster protein YcgN (CxxCxxCC family)
LPKASPPGISGHGHRHSRRDAVLARQDARADERRLVKLEDEESGRIFATDVGCRLFDAGTCRCRDYPNRSTIVPDCVTLTPQEVRSLPWLPPTCGYRLVAEGRDLPWWHPLVSGDPETVVAAGISVRGRVHAAEDEIDEEDLVERVVNWPLRWPKAARTPRG